MLLGCSADGIHDPQKFFPGSDLESWDACSKFGDPAEDQIQICASTGLLPGRSSATYNILFALPNSSHVRIAVFDETAALVKILLDSDEAATLPGLFRQPPIAWDFTDAAGHRVPGGDYRIYFRAGDFLSTSDVPVP